MFVSCLKNWDTNIWSKVVPTLISETTKDFTIMLHMEAEAGAVEDLVSKNKQHTFEYVHNAEKNLLPGITEILVDGTNLIRVDSGVVDMEFKMYTKLNSNVKSWTKYCSVYVDSIEKE